MLCSTWQVQESCRTFEVVINHDPNMVEAFIHLSELKAKQGDLEGALEVLDRDAIETKKDKLLHVKRLKLYLVWITFPGPAKV